MSEDFVTRVQEPMDSAERAWREGAALAVFHALLPEVNMGCMRYRGGLRRIDHGSWECVMAWVEGGRAVELGYANDGFYPDMAGKMEWTSQTPMVAPTVDLLAGGPDWLPWEWLYEVMKDLQNVSYVLWWDGSAWYRAPTPGKLNDSTPGLADTMGVYDRVSELPDYGREGEAQEAYDALLEAGAERRVDRAVLEALAGVLEEPEAADVEAALEEARYLGVAEDGKGAPPVIPAGRGEPADRRVHAPMWQGGASVSVAMLEARERERPDPGRGPALEAVLAWLEDNGHGEDVRVVKHGRFWATQGFSYSEGLSSSYREREKSDLVDAWREEEAHPERGRWLCARIRREEGRTVVERAYDRLPEWQGIVTWDERGLAWLREEMGARCDQWRPEWAPLLEEDFNRDGVPAHLCWRPGLPARYWRPGLSAR